MLTHSAVLGGSNSPRSSDKNQFEFKICGSKFFSALASQKKFFHITKSFGFKSANDKVAVVSSQFF